MTQQQIIDRIMKVKALADQGTDGEREAAQSLLKEMMEKYHVTEADLGVEKKEFYIIKAGDNAYRTLLSQICAKTLGTNIKIGIVEKVLSKKEKKLLSEAGYGDKNGDIGLECTKAEFLEITSLFAIYKEDLKKQLHVFFYAYFKKNGLLIPADERDREPTDEELEIALKARIMAEGIEKKGIHKMIEGE